MHHNEPGCQGNQSSLGLSHHTGRADPGNIRSFSLPIQVKRNTDTWKKCRQVGCKYTKCNISTCSAYEGNPYECTPCLSVSAQRPNLNISIAVRRLKQKANTAVPLMATWGWLGSESIPIWSRVTALKSRLYGWFPFPNKCSVSEWGLWLGLMVIMNVSCPETGHVNSFTSADRTAPLCRCHCNAIIRQVYCEAQTALRFSLGEWNYTISLVSSPVTNSITTLMLSWFRATHTSLH